MLELVLKSNYVIEGGESVGRDVLLAGLSELKVALFPEISLLLCLLKLIVGGLKVVEEHSGRGDERMDDLLESYWIFFIEVV